MMETWQELKVTVKREGEELVSNLLIELGAQGVAIEDSLDYVGNVDRFWFCVLRAWYLNDGNMARVKSYSEA